MLQECLHNLVGPRTTDINPLMSLNMPPSAPEVRDCNEEDVGWLKGTNPKCKARANHETQLESRISNKWTLSLQLMPASGVSASVGMTHCAFQCSTPFCKMDFHGRWSKRRIVLNERCPNSTRPPIISHALSHCYSAMADIDQLFATIHTCIRKIHKLHPDKLNSRRWQVRNVTNRLRAMRPIASGSRTAPSSPCLIDPKDSAGVSASDLVGSVYDDELLSGRRRPLSLNDIGMASLTSNCNPQRHNEESPPIQETCNTDVEPRGRRRTLQEQTVYALSPSSTLTDQQDLTPLANLPTTSSSPKLKTKIKPGKSSSGRAKRSSVALAVATPVGLDRLRKRRREEDSQTTSNNVIGIDTHVSKKRKTATNTHLQADVTLSDLASKFGQRKNIKDIEDSIATLAASQELGDQTYLLQRSQLTASVDDSATGLTRLVPAVVQEIQCSDESLSRLRHRLALADFFKVYNPAQDDPIPFIDQARRVLPKATLAKISPDSNPPSMVKEIFRAIIVDDSRQKRNIDYLRKIDNWRRGGSRWHMLIESFGEGILLLAPDALTNSR